MSQQSNTPQNPQSPQKQQSSGPTFPPGTKPTPQSGEKSSLNPPQNAKPVQAEQTTKKPEQYR